MQLLNICTTAGILAFGIFLVQGCSVTETSEGVGKATSAGGYVTSVSKKAVLSADGCLGAKTSPRSADQTNHSCNKSAELQAEAPVEKPDVVLVSYKGRALFDFDSATMTGEGQNELDQLTAKLNAQDEIEAIEIVGHADNVGSEEYNQALSEKRADAVMKYLQDSLLMVAVNARGLGENAPIGDNDTEAGRTMNRRVDVKIAAMVEN